MSNNLIPDKYSHLKSYLGLLILLLVTFFMYLQVVDFSFISYDDDRYVTDNPDIRQLSADGIKTMLFSPSNRDEIKPPLTVLSLAVNYYFSELEPAGYHLTNLIFHLINIVLVFFLVRMVSANDYAALFVSAVFALHPSASEAVAWVSSRKELQYAFFYLCALLLSLKYWKSGKVTFYLLSIPVFVLSYYSKYSAASFPVLYILLAILYQGRKNYTRVLAESIPFFIFPVYSAYLMIAGKLKVSPPKDVHIESTLPADQATILMTDYLSFNLIQKVFLGGYSFMKYLLKFIWPFEQQLLYPYPPLNESGYLPGEYYVFTALSIVFVCLLGVIAYRNRTILQGYAGFGIIFFIALSAMLLHLLPIGGRVVIADRYMYLPYIGLSLLLFFVLEKLSSYYRQKLLLHVPVFLFSCLLLFQLSARIPDWQNTGTIFTDMVNKNVNSAVIYNNLGNFYLENGKYEKSLTLFNQALELNPHYTEAYNNRGALFQTIGNFKEAQLDLERVLKVQPKNHIALYNLGVLNQEMNEYDTAIYYYNRALKANPNLIEALNNAGRLLMDQKNDFPQAEIYFRRALKLNPKFTLALNNMGMLQRLYYNNGDKALEYFEAAVSSNPENLESYLNIGRIYHERQELNRAVQMFSHIISHDLTYGSAYFHRGIIEFNLGNKDKGCNDLKLAFRYGIQEAVSIFEQFCREIEN